MTTNEPHNDELLGRPYVPAAPSDIATDEQRDTVACIADEYDWVEPSWLADGTVEVAVLDFRGIIERIITVFSDGTTTTVQA